MEPIAEGEVISLNVGGVVMQTKYLTFGRFGSSKLRQLVDRERPLSSKPVFIDRSPKYFKLILDMYRTGALHLSPGLCWHRAKEEVEFWELDPCAFMSPCCSKIVQEVEDREQLAQYLGKQLDDCCSLDVRSKPVVTYDEGSCFSVCRYKVANCSYQVWLFLEEPTSSLPALIWGVVFFLVILISVLIQVAMTHPVFRHPLTEPKWNITGETNTKLIMFATTEINTVIWYLENICFIVFFSELFLRFIVHPAKLSFFKSLYNIIDMVCLIPMVLVVFIDSTKLDYEQKDVFYTAYILSALGVFRILRLFKFLRHFLCVKVLLLSLKASLKEIGLLLILMMVGTLLFANLVYFAELYVEDQFETIPIGFWWAIVTMTTVGYGDKHPRSGWGYVIGAACAILGMLLLGIPIPAIANNFNLLSAMARRKRLTRKQNDKKLSLCLSCTTHTGGRDGVELESNIELSGHTNPVTNSANMAL